MWLIPSLKASREGELATCSGSAFQSRIVHGEEGEFVRVFGGVWDSKGVTMVMAGRACEWGKVLFFGDGNKAVDYLIKDAYTACCSALLQGLPA